MGSAHSRTVASAKKTGEQLAKLFADVGTADNRRGVVQRAYRQARKSLTGANIENLRAVQEILNDFTAEIADATPALLSKAYETGQTQALDDLRAYGERASIVNGVARIGAAENAIMAAVGSQVAGAYALAMLGDVTEIIGDGTRVGMFAPGVLVLQFTRFLVSLSAAGWGETVSKSVPATEYGKQAIAAIDERTTDCCLQVNGQVQPLDGLFQLTGEPRFADEMDGPPFHRFCRTATALVPLRLSDDAISAQMRDAARAEIKAREETGKRVEIHPAYSASRRG